MISIEKTSRKAAGALFWVAGAAIVAMMLLTCADVVLRLFRRPIPGTYELVSFLGAVAVSFAMALTSAEKGHIAVSVVTDLLPKRLQGILAGITGALGLLLFALIARQSFLYAENLRSAGEVSLTLQLPFYPFVYGIALSAAAVCLVLLSEMVTSFCGVFKK